jgi:hypothetical protein
MKRAALALFLSGFMVACGGGSGGGGAAGTTGGAGTTGASGTGGGGTTGSAGTGDAGTTGAAGDTGAAGTTGAAGSGADAAAGTGADGGASTGLAPGTCLAITAGSSDPDCKNNGLPKYQYLCSTGEPPPADSCVHPPSSVVNNDIKYCCAEAVCTRQMYADAFCTGKAGTPHAVQCANDAVAPAGCVTINSQLANRCCP